MKRVRRLWLLAVLGAGVVAVTPFVLGSASASTHKPAPPGTPPTKGHAPTKVRGATSFSCGMTVTTNFTLTADESCSGTAIFIEANGVTVNLGGHTLTGPGSSGYGVEGDFNNDTVTNGVITSFQYGVVFFGNGDKATNLQLDNSSNAGIVTEGSTNVISGNYLLGNATGLWNFEGSGDQDTNNWAESSTTFGIYVEYTTGATISGNKALNAGSGGYGFLVYGTGKVTGNVASGNAVDGFYVDGNTSGFTPTITVSGNRAAFNGGYGFNVPAGGAVDGGGNVVQANGNSTECLNIACHAVDS